MSRRRSAARLSPVPARSLIKQMLAQSDRVLKPAPGVTVLIYHRVGGGSGSEVDLDIDAFHTQLGHLRDHHNVISLDDAVALLDPPPDSPAGGPQHESSVVITFDDGTDAAATGLVAKVKYRGATR